MFKNLFSKSEQLHIYAPLNGQILPLEDVPDPVFNQKIIGEGVAMVPQDGQVYSPIDGEVMLITPTKHAIGLRTPHGIEILIHVGLETVSLDGKGFQLLVGVGDHVTIGQALMTFDLTYIQTHAKDIITPIVLTNQNDAKNEILFTKESNGVYGKTVIMTVSSI